VNFLDSTELWFTKYEYYYYPLKAPLHRLLLLGIILCPFMKWNSLILEGASETHVIKAAYLRNALNFARWPRGDFPGPRSDFVIGFAGEDEKLLNSLRLATPGISQPDQRKFCQ
jgi:hypothetical protein